MKNHGLLESMICDIKGIKHGIMVEHRDKLSRYEIIFELGDEVYLGFCFMG